VDHTSYNDEAKRGKAQEDVALTKIIVPRVQLCLQSVDDNQLTEIHLSHGC